jgi:oxygen-independent coproporphyrinogen-3 oxidase
VPPDRFWNVRDWAEYRERLEAGASPEAGRERLGWEELDLERIWLGLRVDEGVSLAELAAPQHVSIDRWCRAGWATVAGGRVRLTPAGWLLLDRLAVELAAASS